MRAATSRTRIVSVTLASVCRYFTLVTHHGCASALTLEDCCYRQNVAGVHRPGRRHRPDDPEVQEGRLQPRLEHHAEAIVRLHPLTRVAFRCRELLSHLRRRCWPIAVTASPDDALSLFSYSDVKCSEKNPLVVKVNAHCDDSSTPQPPSEEHWHL